MGSRRATTRTRLLVALAFATIAMMVAPAWAWAAVSVADPRVVQDSSMTSGQVTTWDCVWLGSYPQTYVDDAATVAELDAASGWDAEGDLAYGGATYRRLQESSTTYSSTSSDYWSWGDKASAAGWCYFLWEPVKWRVLEADGSSALVVADVALDTQRYNKTNTDVTWANCTLRGWLNGEFWGDCLTAAQQGAVVTQALANDDNIYYGTPGGAETTDSVFLLAESDVWSGGSATRHGFATAYGTCDEARRCKTSDYAHAMGTWNSTSSSYLGNCYWWLRSPGSYASYAARVHYGGDVDRYGVKADAGWWIILWIVCTLFTMATPPVSGGAISCLSVLIIQMGIPQEAIAIGATATIFLDFLTTSSRIFMSHLETLLQADRLGLLNREILQKK